MKINKTNAARLLDKAKIDYELIPYEVDENDLSAIHVRHLFFTVTKAAILFASSRVNTKLI